MNTEITRTRYELSATYDRCKSFYGKATVVIERDGTRTLYSYHTPVCNIDNSGNVTRYWHGYSVTTMRHVNEFLAQETARIAGRARCIGGKRYWDSLNVIDMPYIRYFI